MAFRTAQYLIRLSMRSNTNRLALRNTSVSAKTYSSVSNDMEEAKKRVALLTEDPGNDVKLKMYALYKQATVGECNVKKPGVFDFVGQAKWSAWNGLGGISQVDAEKQYLQLVDTLAGPMGSPAPVEETTDTASTVDGIDVTKSDGVCTITFNRPKKLNAITTLMYDAIRDALNETANDSSIKVAVITGAGDFYCSGNDLSNFTNIPAEGPAKLAADGRDRLRAFVQSFINYPKPLVCAVNGPAIGISVTVMALADFVYASDTATFHTPFTSLGQSPEGCSSYTFPKIMGGARASEVLLAGRKLTAHEAFERGLVTDVIPHSEFKQSINEKVKHLAALPPKSVMYSKALTRSREKEILERVNEEECVRLEERWLSEECMNAVMSFLAKNSKM